MNPEEDMCTDLQYEARWCIELPDTEHTIS